MSDDTQVPLVPEDRAEDVSPPYENWGDRGRDIVFIMAYRQPDQLFVTISRFVLCFVVVMSRAWPLGKV